jgi:biotin carboxyl carrier protein
MKLETAIVAWRDGVIKALHVAPGQTFERAAPLVTLEAKDQE